MLACLKRLAADTGLTQRTIQRSVTRLTTAGHFEIVKHGNRIESNHYKPDFSLLDRVETSTSLPSREVETAKTVCRDSQVSKVETPTSLKPINEPEHKAKGELEGLSANATSDAALASPLGGLPLSSKEKFKYPEFWNVYPTRKNVGKTEDEITIKLNDGVLLADIVEGVRLYAINVQSKRASWKGDKDYTIHPQNFVKDSRWLDDWAIAPKTEVKSRVVKAKVAVIIDKPTIEDITNEDINKVFDKLYDHSENCKKGCKGGWDSWDDFIEKENQFLFKFCVIGKPLYYEYNRLCALVNGTEKTGDATKEELIDAFYVFKKDEYYFNHWNGIVTEERSILSEDGFYQVQINALHLFK